MDDTRTNQFDEYTAFICTYWDGIRKLGEALNRGVGGKFLTVEEQKELKKQFDTVEKTYLKIRRKELI